MFPATLFEFVLFGMAVYKTIVSSSAKMKVNGRRSLAAILLHGNIVYFFLYAFWIMRAHVILKVRFIFRMACVFVFNNLMVAVSLSGDEYQFLV